MREEGGAVCTVCASVLVTCLWDVHKQASIPSEAIGCFPPPYMRADMHACVCAKSSAALRADTRLLLVSQTVGKQTCLRSRRRPLPFSKCSTVKTYISQLV